VLSGSSGAMRRVSVGAFTNASRSASVNDDGPDPREQSGAESSMGIQIPSRVTLYRNHVQIRKRLHRDVAPQIVNVVAHVATLTCAPPLPS